MDTSASARSAYSQPHFPATMNVQRRIVMIRTTPNVPQGNSVTAGFPPRPAENKPVEYKPAAMSEEQELEIMRSVLKDFEAKKIPFTSEFLPVENPFGDEVPASDSLADTIWYDHQLSKPHQIAIPLDRKTAEPGEYVNYELLHHMIVNVPKKMPPAYIEIFDRLASARFRYFASYQLFLAEKRSGIDSIAALFVLRDKRLQIHTNPALYNFELAMKNEQALQRLAADCERDKQRYEVCRRGLARRTKEFAAIKSEAMPYINRLRAAFREMQRIYAEREEKRKTEKEKAELARIEKEKAEQEKRMNDKATQVSSKRAADRTARLDRDAQLWAAYLANSKRIRGEEETDSDRAATKRIRTGGKR